MLLHPPPQHKKNTSDILHSYVPITATSLQQLLSSVPKVAVAERFGWSAMANLTPYCHKLWFTAILQLKFEINFSYKSVEDLG